MGVVAGVGYEIYVIQTLEREETDAIFDTFGGSDVEDSGGIGMMTFGSETQVVTLPNEIAYSTTNSSAGDGVDFDSMVSLTTAPESMLMSGPPPPISTPPVST